MASIANGCTDRNLFLGNASQRAFSKKQKIAVELISGKSGEADHIVPYSHGGETAVENCQILSSEMNKKKSSSSFAPRRWQSEFLREWDDRKPNCPFMLIAVPGAGKTMAALEACRRWMAAGSDRRIVFVVPTDNLRSQWQKEASSFGIALQTKEFGTNFKDGFQGAVVTYHLVANQPFVFRKLCSVSPTMVVFDEIHHCGDEAHFGKGITEAFGLARERLLMSGTPWKSDGRSIPFVEYDINGFAVGDFTYEYRRALNEDVIRPIVFDHAKGTIKNDCTNERESLSQEISDNEAAQRLKKLLDPNGDYVREQILSAHRKLIEVRKTIPDAAGLAACIDQFHAVKVASLIREVTGCEPSVIVSDADIENDNVEAFCKSSKEWLVAVRKVSEGTDIKRLQVLCYLTNTTSELFFRQLVGRVSRVRGLEDFEAYVYLPADPRLIRCAQNIENAQVQALRDRIEKELRELNERQQQLDFASYSTQHDGTEVVLIGSESVPIGYAKKIEQAAEATGVSMQKVMQILSMTAGISTEVSIDRTAASEPCKEDRMNSLRKKCSNAAFRLSKVLGIDVKDVHRKFKPQRELTELELQHKLDQLVKECGKALS
jgi:superfamily II DNA or RNA helicase